MKYTPLELPGVWLIEPVRHGDARGYFCETFRADTLESATGIRAAFVQDNESVSSRGVVRGLHYQSGDAAQAKLVRVTAGEIVDVAVDMRRSSPTFGRHIAVPLSAADGRQLYIPRGFAHGFAVLSDTAQFQYKVDNYYCPEAERSLRFDDPTVGVAWPLAKEDMLLSPKDLAGRNFADCDFFD